MHITQQPSITMPNEMANMVKMKVSSGEYASESEVIHEGLRALLARATLCKRGWLRNIPQQSSRTAKVCVCFPGTAS